jgi:hypothetical protein
MRGNELTLLGWTMLHVTWAQVVHQPAKVAAVIRRALQLLVDEGTYEQNWV